jgi:hypothetical protein
MRRRLFAATLLGSANGASAAVLLGGPVVDALADPPREGFPPDPPAKANTKQWVFQIIAKQGVPSIGKITQVTLKKAEGTARVMGRYALELYVGTEILDRLRFNVPLGGDGPRPGDDQPGKSRPKFRANTKFFVRMADNARASRLRFVDRATGDITVFLWPPNGTGKLQLANPEASADGGTADGGTADGGAAKDGGASKDGGAPKDAGAPKAPPKDAALPRDAGRHNPAEP